MDKIDWSRFTRSINIRADKETVFQHWSSQEKLEQWFLSQAQFYSGDKPKARTAQIEKGDSYKWMWHGSDNVAEGEIISVDPSESVVFTFLGCKVSASIKQGADSLILEIEQSEIPTDETSKLNTYVECTRGWTFYMTNLKSILEGGIDLRNKDPLIQCVINT